MTIILQHQFWDLEVTEQTFQVGLSFGGTAELLVIPFDSVTGFFDPSVQFGLKFEIQDVAPEAGANDTAPTKGAGAKIRGQVAGKSERGAADPCARGRCRADDGAAERARRPNRRRPARPPQRRNRPTKSRKSQPAKAARPARPRSFRSTHSARSLDFGAPTCRSPLQPRADRKVRNPAVDMAEIVNLRRARKAKARHAAETAAQANRLAFGRHEIRAASHAERTRPCAPPHRRTSAPPAIAGTIPGTIQARISLAMATTEPHGLPAAARIAKRSLVISGHRTSVSLEGVFWNALKEAATARSLSVANLVADIDATRGEANLSSAIRVYLFSLDRARDISPPRRA